MSRLNPRPTRFRDRVLPAKFEQARLLRKNNTASERLLWEELRSRKLDGHKFRQQAVILGWIADFYCPGNHLVVELDGCSHNSRRQQDKDKYRDDVMKRHRFHILRISSSRVFTDLPAVLAEIRAALPKAPSPGSRSPRSQVLTGMN